MVSSRYPTSRRKGLKIKAWLPAIAVGTGTDVFTRRLADALEKQGISVRITWIPRYFELIPHCLKIMAPPFGTDVVIVNSWNGFAFKRYRLPLIVVVHHASFEADLAPYKSRLQRLYHRWFAVPREAHSLRVADAVVAVSAYVADRVRERYRVENVEVIHNWVDTERFCPALQAVRGRGPFRLLFVGKPTRLKGADLLAPVMRELGEEFELHVTATAEECSWLGLPSNVHFLGRLSEDRLIRAYQHCDALLCPSRSEGFGYAVLEAMACGKPVIASKATALTELVVDGVTGVLCELNNITEIVAACRQLSDNPAGCCKMGIAARGMAIEKNRDVQPYVEVIRRATGRLATP